MIPAGYASNAELPAGVRASLPDDAQEVWRMAFNSAVASSSTNPAVRAWAAVDMGWDSAEGDYHQRALLAKFFDESKHPRHPSGTPGSVGGQFAPKDGVGVAEHPGEGYSKDARLLHGVIYTPHVEDAARALHEGRKVELDQVRKVSTLLDRLGALSKEAIEKGDAAPRYNLCDVSVRGTNLFCLGHLGLSRVQMPQLGRTVNDDQTEAFVSYLKDKGYSVKSGNEFASHLRATQNELDGTKVAGIANRIRAGNYHEPNPLVVSKDDYIVDGHHRWAAKIGLDAANGVLSDEMKIPVRRVNIGIIDLLREADTFTEGKGKLAFGQFNKVYFVDFERTCCVRKGEPEGHPFRGNQYTGGISSGVTRPLIANAEDSPEFASRVRAGIEAIPPEHAARLKEIPVWISEEFPPSLAEMETGRSRTQGQFSFPPGQQPFIEIAETSANPIGGGMRPILDPEGVTVHELGHALDHSVKLKEGDKTYDWGLSKTMGFDLTDGLKALDRDELAKASYYSRDIREMFAETYRLTHSPSTNDKVRYFGGLTRERARQVFAKGIARVKAVKLMEPVHA